MLGGEPRAAGCLLSVTARSLVSPHRCLRWFAWVLEEPVGLHLLTFFLKTREIDVSAPSYTWPYSVLVPALRGLGCG